MKKNLLLLSLSFSVFSFSQTTIFEDSFETYPDFTIQNFGDWVMYDVDQANTWGVYECDFPHEGEPMAGIVFNPSQCTDPNGNPFDASACNYSTLTGDKYITFWCAQNTNNDNFLVSPQIDLTNVSSASISLQAKQLANVSGGFDPEHFEILVSTTSNTVADFSNNIGDTSLPDNCTWYEYNYDLSDYVGQSIFIAIHHITTQNGYALHIDDFKVEGTTSTTSVNDYNTFDANIYPNPANNMLFIDSEVDINKVEIHNVVGQKVTSLTSDTLIHSIPISTIDSGIYYAILFSNKGTKSIRFVKNN